MSKITPPAILELQEIFEHHSIPQCVEDNCKMYFQFMNNEINDDAFARQTATETFFRVNQLLACIEEGKKPEEVLFIKIPMDYV